MNEFHFIRPYYLLLLVPLLYLLWQLWKHSSGGNAWKALCDSHLLPYILTVNSGNKKRFPLYLLSIGWLLTAIALAGPTWSRLPQPVYQTLKPTVIVMHLSNSMLSTDIQPNRLTRAKYKIKDILKAKREGQIALIVFSAEPYVVSPLTQDASTIAAMIPELDPSIMPVQGSDIGAALMKASQLLNQGGQSKGQIILITDSKVSARDLDIANKLSKQGIKTSVLGIATVKGTPVNGQDGFEKNRQGDILISKLDRPGLQNLAKAGNGRYADFSNTQQDIHYLLSNQKASLEFNANKTHSMTSKWRDEGHWLILLLLPFAALGFRKGWFEEI